MSNPNIGSQTKIRGFTETQNTTQVTVVPRIVTQSEQIARYFTEDLTHFVADTQINLAEELNIPDDYPQSAEEIIEMLYDDLSHMLRNGLITGIHLLLSEQQPDPNTHAYPLRYHAEYVINVRTLRGNSQFGGNLAPPKNTWVNSRFALLIDWNMNATEQRRQVRRPEYCFDWVPEQEHFDATSLVRFREGGMTFDGAEVERIESASPGYQGRNH